MVGLEYIRMEEVPAMPKRTEPFGVAVYAPLAEAPVDPDVVLVRGDARQIMLVAEAARAAGIGHDGASMGRPACSMIPQAMSTARGNTSLGCIGNRVYTGLGDAELYFTIPGSRLPDVVAKLETVVHANRELQQYHERRGPPSPDPWTRPSPAARRRSHPEHRRTLLHPDPRRHGGAGREGGASRPGRRRARLGAALLGA
jgi:hypothetical protein